MVDIRNATENDLEKIRSFFNYGIERTTAIYTNTLMTEDQIQTWFKNKNLNNYPVLVAVIDQQVVGFSSYGAFRPAEGYRSTVEHAVHIDPRFHGRGLGTQLMTALIERAKAQGYHALIGAIDSTNTPSLKLHEKMGFKIVGEIPQVARKFDRWLTLILMQMIFES